MKITNDDFNFDNNRDMKDVKLRIINEKRENNRDKLSRVTSEKYSKNSLENSSSKKTVKEEKNAIESDSNISKSVKVKLIGLNNNKYIVKGKNEKMEKDYEQLKLSKDIYINEIMKLRNELDIANTKLIKELKEKNNLLRLYEEMSSRLNSSNFKTFNEKDKIKNKSKITSSKNYFEEDLLKLLELKEKEYNNLLKENLILKNDNKKLKDEIKKYKTSEKVELIKQNNDKDRQIHELKKLNEENKRLLNNLKYEKIIKNLNKEMDKKEEIINNLNDKLNTFKLRRRENIFNNSFNLKLNNINNYSNQRYPNNQFHSFSRLDSKKELKKNKSDILKRGNTFYTLFDEKERNAINTLFDSVEDLNNFKAKIENIEKRNNNVEIMLKNENNELIRKNRQKEEIIRELNEKEKENLKRISDCKLQLKTNQNINDRLEKIIKRKDETENIYIELIKKKEEEVQKLINEKQMLIETIQKNKEDIRRLNMMKNREKDLQSFKDELGVINVLDIDKVLKPRKKSYTLPLSIQKNDYLYFKGLPSMNRVSETQEEDEDSKESTESKESRESKESESKESKEKKIVNIKPKQIKEEKKDERKYRLCKCKKEK